MSADNYKERRDYAWPFGRPTSDWSPSFSVTDIRDMRDPEELGNIILTVGVKEWRLGLG